MNRVVSRRPPHFPTFVRRLLATIAISGVFVLLTLLIGVGGYHRLAHLSWTDALLNASMILGGMGPVDPLPNVESKVFASVYALFCGLVFVGAIGLVISPILHHMLHTFSLADEDINRDP